MKRSLFFFLFAVGSAGYQASAQAPIAAYDAEQLINRIAHKDTVYVVNFWATWCIPCVKELPAFNVIHDLYEGQPVKVILLSFDFKEQYPAKLGAWVKKKKLRPEVAWFKETNPTEYIPKIAPEWEGTLPGTLLLDQRSGKRKMIPNEVTVEELKAWIDEALE